MARNLIICCDGTNNQFGPENTNVVRLVQILARDPGQRLYYDPGVGTMPEPGALSWLSKKLSEIWGLAFGAGLTRKVDDAYTFLMQNWEPGDRVFLFGFSRGAYTVRVLAGLLHQLGLLPRGSHNLVPYTMRLFRAIRGGGQMSGAGKYWQLCNEFREAFARPTRDDAPSSAQRRDTRRFGIHFLGVWDTVSSVGWVWNPATFPFTARNPSIEIVRHAVSIDERRWFFRQNQMYQTGQQDLVELWFPGVHADVGGGYPERKGGLWRAPFEWIVREAEKAGLRIDEERKGRVLTNTPASDRPWNDAQHKSLTWKWWPAEFVLKWQKRADSRLPVPKMGLFRYRFVPEESTIDKTALLRIRETDYAPKNFSGAFLDHVRQLPDVPEQLTYARSPNVRTRIRETDAVDVFPKDFAFRDALDVGGVLPGDLAPERRILQGDLAKLSDDRWISDPSYFVAGVTYQFEVFIGPPGEGALGADQGFPDVQVDYRGSSACTLQVFLTEPRQWEEPLQNTIELPSDRRARSSKCRFDFIPKRPGRFLGRVIVCDRGRVLQTALLSAIVKSAADEPVSNIDNQIEPPRLTVEAELRQSLGTVLARRSFAGCLVLNHSADHRRGMTAASQAGAYVASLDEIDEQVAAISSLLNDVAHNSKRYAAGLSSAANAALLRELAFEGNILYRRIVLDYIDKSPAAKDLREGEHLQIVSATPDAVVPLEFVYAYPPPGAGAPVCPNAAKALQDGCCPGCVPKMSPAPHVCPLGFWGLSKVIERHVHDPELSKPAQIRRVEPVDDRDVLSLDGSSLLAVSREVPRSHWRTLQKTFQDAWNGELCAVQTWDAWREAVQVHKPVVIVALPHTGGTGANISLEISGDVLASVYIDESFVCGDPEKRPVVFLLGCDTASVGSPEMYAHHVAIFRQANAALVLGTIATVFGRDAAAIAEKLVSRLVTIGTNSTDRFGEILRQVKRNAIANSQMLALCLAAFGDADWRFNKERK